MKAEIEKEFKRLCQSHNRKGIIGFSPLEEARLLPIQKKYLERKLSSFDFFKPVTAISIGVFYTPEEIETIPHEWMVKGSPEDKWNVYAQACGKLNRILNSITGSLTGKFGGISEQATTEGLTQKIKQVEDYYGLCISHRAFAEKAGIGWRGKSGLIVTPESGSALRLSTIFVPFEIESSKREFSGCGDCQACLEVCPYLKCEGDYRQSCLLRLKKVALQNEVCGICIRVCMEKQKNNARHKA